MPSGAVVPRTELERLQVQHHEDQQPRAGDDHRRRRQALAARVACGRLHLVVAAAGRAIGEVVAHGLVGVRHEEQHQSRLREVDERVRNQLVRVRVVGRWGSTRTSRFAARCVTRNPAKPRPVSATMTFVPTDEVTKRTRWDMEQGDDAVRGAARTSSRNISPRAGRPQRRRRRGRAALDRRPQCDDDYASRGRTITP